MSVDHTNDNSLNIELSNKISSISLILIIFVLMIHSMNFMWAGSQIVFPVDWLDKLNIFIQNFISNGIARVSVPFFFLISGFFFFKSFSYSVYLIKLKGRVRTLLIPCFFWGALVVLLYYFMQLLPFAENYFTKALIRERSLLDIVIVAWVEPLNYPLWFLRDLFLLILVSPVIYFFITWLKGFFFIIPVLLWLLGMYDTSTELTWFKSEPFLFFFLGVLLAKNISILYKIISDKAFYILLVVYLIILFFKTWLISQSGSYQHDTSVIVLSQLLKLFGIVVIWFWFDRVALYKFKALLSFTFLIFVFHEPMLTIFSKGGYAVFGVNSISSFILYFLSPFLVLITLYYIGSIFMKRFPAFVKLVTGGRLKT